MRKHFMYKLTALTLALLMPLCCCQLHIIGMLLTAPAQESAAITACQQTTKSCCAQQSRDADKGDEPANDSDGTCGACCYTKIAVAIADWSPPVDKIGSELPAWTGPDVALQTDQEPAINITARLGPEQPPPLAPQTLLQLHCALLV